MKKIDNFTNLYPVTKTLKFRLIPVGKTQENFDKNKLLDIDKERAEKYKQAKRIIDKFFREFINDCLNNCVFDKNDNNLHKYIEVYNNNKLEKVEKTKELKELSKLLRNEIVQRFEEHDNIYKKLFNNKDLLNIILDDKRITEDEKNIIRSFNNFSTYFSGFLINRKNIFSSEEKVGSIAYRCVNENLKTHIFNINVYNRVKDALKNEVDLIEEEFKDKLKSFRLKDIFNIDYFEYCLTGSDIVQYNEIIGGFTSNENPKVQGLNEYINLYNQKNKDAKLPSFKKLKKQILSEDESDSFRYDVIDSDEQLNKMLNMLSDLICRNNFEILNTLEELLQGLKDGNYDYAKIYLNSKNFSYLSEKCFEDYSIIKSAINNEYDITHNRGKNTKKYEDDKENYFKNLKNLSINELFECLNLLDFDTTKLTNELYAILHNVVNSIKSALSAYNALSHVDNIRNDSKTVSCIKELLDSILGLYKYKDYYLYEDGYEIDDYFYSNLATIDKLDDIVGIYNKARNYITKKPYKIDKFKLNFNCPNLLSGWDTSFNRNSSAIIQYNKKYYLMLCAEKLDDIDIKNVYDVDENDCAIYYEYNFQKQDNKNFPRIFIRSKGDRFAPAVEKYNLPVKDIIDIYDKKLFTTEMKKVDEAIFKKSLIKMIDYFKLGMERHEIFKDFKFKWKKSEDYTSIDKFYNDAVAMCYMITPKSVNFKNISKLTNNGKIYLFEIYSKDFSKYSKGTNNLNTLYFKEIFSDENLENVVYKLNGKAEIFYREKSIAYTATHKQNDPIPNKNTDNIKKTSIFKYDIAKDKRFTEDQFQFHVPVTINFKSNDNLYNDAVNDAIKDCGDNYVIGIDRGERNLIYINVVSEKRGLVEQLSLNNIVNEYNGNTYRTDYHKLLNDKEKERDEAKKTWGTIENIKELKEGYVSQVVHKICELVEKYDAIIVMEDLNSGFKNSRVKVEKQVYQKFEKMLIDKLNLYINKKHECNKIGGLLKGYQLTRPYQSNQQMAYQNGFIYYVGPWNTSKIDPTTGFVNLFRLNNYTSIKAKKEFVGKFDSISYNNVEGAFELSFDYNNFDYGATDFTGKWTISSRGKRILNYRNKEKNSSWDNKDMFPTEELKNLFNKYNINYREGDIKNYISEIDDKKFFDQFLDILKLILQMRNSISNTNVDYLISPVKNRSGEYYNSDKVKENNLNLPVDADSNGAYNIARKGLMIIDRIKNGVTDKLTVISNKDWLEYAQTHLPL